MSASLANARSLVAVTVMVALAGCSTLSALLLGRAGVSTDCKAHRSNPCTLKHHGSLGCRWLMPFWIGGPRRFGYHACRSSSAISLRSGRGAAW